MQLLWKYLKQYKKTLVGALVLATINQFFSLIDPQIFRLLIDRYASRYQELSQGEFLQGVILLLLAAVGVALVSRLAKNFQDYYVNVITERLGARLYEDSVAHSFSLPFTAFEDQRSGELLQKLEKARTDAKKLIKSAVSVIFLSLVGIVLVVTYAFYVHWVIGAVYLLMVPLLGLVTYFLSRQIKKAQSAIVREEAGLAGSTTETLRNVELVRSLGLEEQEISRLNTVNETILKLELKKVILVRKLSFWQGTMINGLRSALLLLMLWLIFQGSITIGEFLSLYIYSFFIFSPLYELGQVATEYQEAKASSQQLQEILRIQPEPRPDHPQPAGELKQIAFREVSFTYASAPQPALQGISLTMRSGETVAFVGPSGSGKTTMVKLLAGLYRPEAGTIRINEVDTQALDFVQFRQRIGLVAQETQLFAGTIRENLLFVRPQASDDECRAALTASAADSILRRASQGLDTKIGEGGLKLSGGERQRLAIARALLRQPDLIIFDEATSSLDSITERAITETIRDIEKTHTQLITVLVAHRLSTIAHADRIYVFEHGAIIEHGSHEALLKQGGLYAALWREQVHRTDGFSAGVSRASA
ncbi:MAG: ABC transporter ATP-binding protein [Candidatus Kerfeldbacteria bacterium]|nr:ABC transporter ATP-binding protein [Candidatus Kerfeldbacteria bacterium]